MTDFVRINAPRVEKIAGLIAQIEKSARSQRPTTEERADMGDRIDRALGVWGPPLTPAEGAAPVSAPVGEAPAKPANPVAVSHWVHQMDPACFNACVAAVMARLNDERKA